MFALFGRHLTPIGEVVVEVEVDITADGEFVDTSEQLGALVLQVGSGFRSVLGHELNRTAPNGGGPLPLAGVRSAMRRRASYGPGMRRLGAVVIAVLLVAACTADDPSSIDDSSSTAPPSTASSLRIVLVGDVMLGRGVTRQIETDPGEVFAGVRHLLADADLTAANLESPLTARPHLAPGGNELEADPAGAGLLADTGFDVVSLPNNHVGDAGPAGVEDTLDALRRAGIASIGAGPDARSAAEPKTFVLGGLSIGFLAFDATGAALVAGPGPGVVEWDPESSPTAVADLADRADLVIVSVHGGTEYLPVNDPWLTDLAAVAVAAGADVVWGHGAHVAQPIVATGGRRPSVVATSLGNFLFDQTGEDRTTGSLLEILADDHGVVAYRVAVTEHPERRVVFVEWQQPSADAAWLDGSWWSLLRLPEIETATTVSPTGFRAGDLITAATGDITGDGSPELVASFRRPFEPTTFTNLRPDIGWSDSTGRSAHLGVFEPSTLNQIWVAGTVIHPIAELAVCDGSLSVIHDSLDDARPVAAGAWSWNGFGFDTAPELSGPGEPGCGDLDGDGRTEPVVRRRGTG